MGPTPFYRLVAFQVRRSTGLNMTFEGKIIAHAKRSEPHESFGFIVSKGGELRYFPCENIAVDPINHFEISPDDWIAVDV